MGEFERGGAHWTVKKPILRLGSLLRVEHHGSSLPVPALVNSVLSQGTTVGPLHQAEIESRPLPITLKLPCPIRQQPWSADISATNKRKGSWPSLGRGSGRLNVFEAHAAGADLFGIPGPPTERRFRVRK